jgi:hypothetical protein
MGTNALMQILLTMYKLFSASLDHIQFSETNSLELAMYEARCFAVNLRVRTIILTPSGRTVQFDKQGKLV